MRYFILTDIEGVAGIDSFDRTRTDDERQKKPAMDQLAREVNACVAGIRSVDPDATIDVWDGHGSGGLRPEAIEDATYLREGRPYQDLGDTAAMYFVGQHAMAGTAFAPLRHTYSSRTVAYYKLNGTFIGEFGGRAFLAGRQGVPTVFLSGDDKACREAELFVPDIETVAVKVGQGEEAADHMDQTAACAAVEDGAARATERIDAIDPLVGFKPPYDLEIRYLGPVDDEKVEDRGATRIDSRTISIEGTDPLDPDDPLYGIL